MNPSTLHWELGVLATGPPGKALEVTSGIISLRICYRPTVSLHCQKGIKDQSQPPLQTSLPLIPNSSCSPRHTNSLPQTNLLLFLLQTFTHNFRVPAVLVILPLDLHFFQLSFTLGKDTPMYPGAEAWNLSCFILNFFFLTTHLYISPNP